MKKVFKKDPSLHCKYEEKINRLNFPREITVKSECGHMLQTIRNMFKRMKYCPYCGRWIKEVKA